MILSVENAGFRRGQRWIFRNLSFAAKRGEAVAILGPNGRGKTTLLKTLLGFEALDEGNRAAPPIIGYVPQSMGIASTHRCLDIVVMARAKRIGLFGLPGKEDRIAALQAMEMVGATRFADHAFNRLSGGERQIVMVARAIASGAEVLVLDEPASSLDLANQDILLGVLSQLRSMGQHAIIFTTHHPEHALHIADQALLMHQHNDFTFGPVLDVMTETELQKLYGIAVKRVAVSDDHRSQEAVIPMFSGHYHADHKTENSVKAGR